MIKNNSSDDSSPSDSPPMVRASRNHSVCVFYALVECSLLAKKKPSSVSTQEINVDRAQLQALSFRKLTE